MANSAVAQSGWTTDDGNGRRTRVSAHAGPIQPTDEWLYPLDGFQFHPVVSSQGTSFVSSTNAVRAIDVGGSLLWTYSGDSYFGSPALSDDEEILYQASRTGMVYAIDAATGNEIWAFAASGPTDIMSVEAVGLDDAVYSNVSGGHLIVANADGTLRWSYGAGRSIGTVALADDGTLRVNDDGDLVSLSSGGTEQWRVQREELLDRPVGSPAVRPDGSTLLCSGFFIASVSPTGSVNWMTDQRCSSMALLDGFLVVSHNNGMEAYDYDGSQRWAVALPLIRTLLAVDSNGVIYVAGDETGILAFNRHGVRLWNLAVTPPAYSVLPAPGGRLVAALYNSSTFAGALVSATDVAGDLKVTDVTQSVLYFNPGSQATPSELQVSVRNVGTTSVNVSAPVVQGADANAFSVSALAGFIPPGDSITFDVSFAAPDAQAFFSADLVIPTDASTGNHSVELLGSVGVPTLAKGGWPTPFHDQNWSGSSEYLAPAVDASVMWEFCEGITSVFSGIDTTPVAAADGSVFVLGNAATVYHLSRTGNLLSVYDASAPSVLRSDGTFLSGNEPMRATTRMNNVLWSKHGSTSNEDFVTAIASDGTFYYVAGNNFGPRIIAISSSGETLWERQIDSHTTGAHRGLLLADDGTILYKARRRITALDRDGNQLWTSTEADRPLPAITPDGAVIIANNTSIRGLDLLTGTQLWSVEGLDNSSTGDISVAPDGTIFSGRHIVNADGTLRASPFSTTARTTISGDGYVLRTEGGDLRVYNQDGSLVRSVSSANNVSGEQVILADNGLAYVRGPGCLVAIGSEAAQQPAINLSTSDLAFGAVEPSQSAQQSVTVSNTGSAAADVSSLAITGANASDFTVTSPSVPFAINAQQAVEVEIEFSSNVEGPKSATLAITSDAPGSPHQVSLSAEVSTTQQNSAPVAIDDEANVDEDDSVTIAVLDNDTDADEQALSVAEVLSPGNGTAAIVDGTSITYTPDPDYFGPDVFRYLATDGIANSDTATVAVTVNPINDAPVAVDDAVFTARNAAVDFDPRANDSDVDDTDIEFVGVGPTSAGGTVEITGNGLTYAPPTDFTGTDSFEYTISDPQDATATAAVVVNVDIAQFAHTGITSIGVSGVATAVNNNGIVVGAARMSDGSIHAWKYENGTQQMLNLPGTTQSIAYDINDADRIVGFALGADSIGRAFVHEPSGATMYYQPQGSTLSVAYGINESGRVVGQVTTADGGPEARFFAPQFQSGHPIEAAGSEFFAINEDDIAVGVAYRADGTPVPLVGGQILSSSGRIYDASLGGGVGSLFDGSNSIATVWDGDLNVTNPFGTTGFSEAYAINDAGWIVGANQNPAATKRGDEPANLHSRTLKILIASAGKAAIDGLEATLLAGTSLRRLDDVTSASGWTLVEARDINDVGDIVGWGNVGGVPQAFMLSASSNMPPSTRDDEIAAASEGAVTIRVLDNDDDADGDALQIVRVGRPAIGSARVSGDSTSIVYEAGGVEGSDTFTYTVTDGEGSSSTARVRVIVARGLSADRSQIVSRYPNPASSELTIVLNLVAEEPATVEVFDLLGRVVRRVWLHDNGAGLRTIQVPTGRLAPGTYLIRFEHGGDVDTSRFVVIW